MSQDQDKFSVLVVDDDPSVRMLVPNLLRKQGFNVAKAASGREALDQVAKAAPDLILLDVNMPEMTGVEVCEQLKARQETKHIPVIFMTSLGNDVDRLKGFEVGGEDYVMKPVNYRELLARMKRFVQRSDGRVPQGLAEGLQTCVHLAAKLDATELPEALRVTLEALRQKLQSVQQQLGAW